MMNKKLYWDDQGAVSSIRKVLSEGNVVAGTSDTIPGLLAPISLQGVMFLDEIKKRRDKPYLVLIESKKKLLRFIDKEKIHHIESLLEYCWPGPLTVILPPKKEVPSYALSKEGTIALRVPNHEGLLTLLKDFDGLFSTSANIADQPVPKTADEIDPSILEKVAYLVVDSIEVGTSKPSTILDCTGKQIKVVREGEYSVGELEKIYGQQFIKK